MFDFPKIFRSGAPSVKCSNLGGNASAMAWGMAIALRVFLYTDIDQNILCDMYIYIIIEMMYVVFILFTIYSIEHRAIYRLYMIPSKTKGIAI